MTTVETPEAKGRPGLVVTRDRAIPVLTRVVIAGITRTERRSPSYLPLGRDEGLLAGCVASFDDLETVPEAFLTRKLGELGPRMRELCGRLSAMAGCSPARSFWPFLAPTA